MLEINIAQEYTLTPGGRFIKDGAYSGEDFRESKLIPKYNEAVSKNEKLIIDFDGGYGYPTSFLEEAFGGMKRQLKKELNMEIFEFISKDEPGLIDKVKEYIKNGEKKR